MDEWRDLVIRDAKTWLGTPYQHKARVKGIGVDCGALLYSVYEPYFGPFKPFPTDYPPDWALHRDNEIYLDFISPYVVPIDEPVRGGLSLFRLGRAFAHAAIYDGERYIHAWGRNRSGSVIRSKPAFFTIGEKNRPVKHFDLVQH